jgi:hypothetical protein
MDFAGNSVVRITDREMPGPHCRPLPRLDIRKLETDAGFRAFDLDQLEAFELLRLALGLAGRARLGAIFVDERFELPALTEGSRVYAAVVLLPLG